MKKNFRKALSIICVLALLMSTVSMMLTTSTSAVALTGVAGIVDSGQEKTPYTVEDGGVTVANCSGSNTRPSCGIANADGTGYFTVEKGKTYFMSVDIKVVSSSATTAGTDVTWAPYFGDKAQYDSTKPKKAITVTGTTIATNVYISNLATDGEWCTVYAYFTVPAEAEFIDNGSCHVFASVYSNQPFTTYVKNGHCEEVTGDKTPVVYYDNGETYVELGKVNDTITREGQNAVPGEKFMYWYATPDFTGEQTYTVPETTTNAQTGTASYLFARYPTIVFSGRGLSAKGVNGANVYCANSCTLACYKGEYYFKNAGNSAVMIPAYDYAGYFKDAAFFQFSSAVGTTYTIAFDYRNCVNGYQFTPAKTANGSGQRYTAGSGSCEFGITLTKNSAESKHFVSKVFSYKTSTATNYAACGMSLRATSNSTSEIYIDNLMITEYSAATADYVVPVLTLSDGKTGYKESIEFETGTSVILPELEDTDDYMFVGWKNAAYNAGSGQSQFTDTMVKDTETGKDTSTPVEQQTVTNDFRPKSVITSEGESKTLVAQWVKKVVEVNFTASVYSGTNFAEGHAGNNDCSGDIYYDSADGAIHYSKTSKNGYKFLLYDDDGNPVIAAEGVDYKVTLEYAVTGTAAAARIGLVRECKNNMNPCDVAGSTGNGTNAFFINQGETPALVEKTTTTINTTVKNMYDYRLNGGAARKAVRDIFAISPQLGEGIIYSVKIEALDYHPYAYGENCTIEYDYENGNVTVTPDAGYELKVGSVNAYSIVNDKYLSNEKTNIEATLKDGAYVISGVGIDYENLVIEATAVVAGSEVNAKVIGSSYYQKKNDEDKAGIRFLNRVSDGTMDTLESAYFAIVPTALMGEKTMLEYLEDDENLAVTGVAYDKGQSIDICYAIGNGTVDYQVLLAGLVSALEDTEMTVTFIGVKSDDSKVILGERKDSYKAIYDRVNG